MTSPGVAATSSRSADRVVHVVAQPLQLVRALAEHRVELGQRDRNEVRMRHPGPVEAVLRLATLVLLDLGEGNLVHLGIAAARDESGHSADGVGAALVARAHESSVYARMNGTVIVT